MILRLSYSVETNLGLKQSFSNLVLKTCHWNLSSLSSHMCKKVSLFFAFISVYKLVKTINIILTPKLHLMTKIWDYLVTVLLEKISKRERVSIYCKNTLPFKLSNIKYLQECITKEYRENVANSFVSLDLQVKPITNLNPY